MPRLLTCSLTDTQLAEFIQYKKRNTHLRKLNAVSYVGLQDDESWVLSYDIHISSSGQLLEVHYYKELLYDAVYCS